MRIDWLAEPALVLTGALLAVLLLRPMVRRGFGAAAAYGLWALVPASLVAVLLPAAAEPVLPTLVQVAPLAAAPAGGTMVAVGDDPGRWLPLAWAAGALVVLGRLLWQQRRFMAGLGPVSRRPDGLHQCVATRGLPAVLGLRPRIVLPGDFEERYDPVERELVLAHETEHLRRGDLPACLLASALQALFWFHPLVHLAAGRFRQDQELACDAAVLRRYPGQRRRYADAMLKTRLAGQPLPIGCHWSGVHPLKERLAMLRNPLPSRRRRQAGLTLVFSLSMASAALAWATQPAPAAEGASPRPADNGMAAVGIDGAAPAYPKAAADAGEGGMVMLNVLVGVDGRAEEVRFVPEKSTVAEDSEITRNTLEAAATWKFQPAIEDGKPVKSRVLVPVRFDPPAGAVAPEA